MGTLAGQNRRGQKGQDILEAPSSCPQRCRLRPPTLTQTPPAHGETGQRKIQGQAQGSAEAQGAMRPATVGELLIHTNSRQIRKGNIATSL